MGGMDAIIQEFLGESFENLEGLDGTAETLLQSLTEPESLGHIFRTIHTIKGTCGFLAFNKLEDVSMAAENVLGQLREDTLELTPEVANALNAGIEGVRTILTCIRDAGGEGDGDFSEAITNLNGLLG